MRLSILYRGVLSNCNYSCAYCPFAKHRSSPAELAKDRDDLDRFVRWIESRRDVEFAVLFTPWGEALIRHWYSEAIVQLSRLSNVRKVAVQTNLSCSLEWLDHCRRERVAFWCTCHPSQVPLSRFLARCGELDRRGIRYNVGIVGVREHFEAIEHLRTQLDPNVYLWVNAYKREPDYYRPEDVERIETADPLFRVSLVSHASLGRPCRCGESVIAVDGDGQVRRCHFVSEPIGNLYAPGFEESLVSRPCPNLRCNCHIGYVHMPHLGLYDVFGEGVLERIPREPIWKHHGLLGSSVTQRMLLRRFELPVPARPDSVGPNGRRG
jgi:MoaA/NifB/PqqE/SkfB family radical SAM enzyme